MAIHHGALCLEVWYGRCCDKALPVVQQPDRENIVAAVAVSYNTCFYHLKVLLTRPRGSRWCLCLAGTAHASMFCAAGHHWLKANHRRPHGVADTAR